MRQQRPGGRYDWLATIVVDGGSASVTGSPFGVTAVPAR